MGKKGQGKFGGRPGGSSPPEERARIGAELLANKRFRDAIEIFKPLLAFEARPEWKESLAAAYAGHAQNLADKGMVGEALVVWENRRRFCGKPLMEAPWFDWILKSKNGERELCAQISRMGSFSEADPALAKNLAWPLFFLSDHSFAAIRNVDPLIEMCRLARESWHHYERGEKEKAEETSGRIPDEECHGGLSGGSGNPSPQDAVTSSRTREVGNRPHGGPTPSGRSPEPREPDVRLQGVAGGVLRPIEKGAP